VASRSQRSSKIRTERLELDEDTLAELSATVALLRRWSKHPAFPNLVASLANATEVHHIVILLATASRLVDAGNNGVAVVNLGSSGRIADLYLEVSLAERLDVEIKTPLALWARERRPQELARSDPDSQVTGKEVGIRNRRSA
jgi:hypothetical protein